MVQKRPYDDEEVFRISFKHPRQAEHTKELVSFSESVFPSDGTELPHSLENGLTNAGTEGDEKLCGDVSADLPKDGEDTETSAPGCFSTSSWPTSSTSEEESLSEPPFYMSLFPEYFSSERPIRTALAHCEDIYNLLVNHPPRKTVPIGPHHQADIPSWGVKKCEDNVLSASCQSEDVSQSEAGDEQRLMGTCIIPMPDFASPVHTDPKIGSGRTDCSCDDKGSFSCVRKHIKEAREELVKAIGVEGFMELGFCDMGEEVALRWSEEEEQAFHHIVFSNPVSLGNNFWDKLSDVFPNRTKKDVVSYYFNVFMLRKRADQNRCDPAIIDSDNDEWQGSDDYGDNEVEEDDDSVVESPIGEDNLPERNDIAEETCNPNPTLESDEVSEIQCPQQISSYSSCQGDQEIIAQGDSCSSFDAAPGSSPRNPTVPENDNSRLRNHMGSENGNHCPSGSFNRFILEPCYAKDWDAGFMTCSKNQVDFLPTCNVIEEVFAEEMKNHKVVSDGKNLN